MTLHRLATAKHRLTRGRAAREDPRARRYRRDHGSRPQQESDARRNPSGKAAAAPAAAPRIKLSPHGFCIDHPDPELGERLMADALGFADPDAMHGVLRQLVRASVKGERCDEVNLAFMMSMIRSIKPRNCVEAMLVAQMVSVHVMAMRCALHLASADDVAQLDSAGRALGRLARTFPAQIEALNRYRSHGELANPPSACRTYRSAMRQRHCRQRHPACPRSSRLTVKKKHPPGAVRRASCVIKLERTSI
jgi:hypothetical protein